MNLGFLSSEYPSNDYTNSNNLYMSLGSFWTQVFQETGTLKGYTLATAEELIQSYYSLIETLNSYSVKEIAIFNKVKWQPLVIQKSKFNYTPIEFAPKSVVFGSQPASDVYYAGQTFRFGKSKSTSNGVFSFSPDFELRKFSIIADKVVSPSTLYLNGVDVVIDSSNLLYFNTDIFSNSNIPKTNLINNNGTPATFVDQNGVTQNDQIIILWCYNAENDTQELYKNFGSLFDLRLDSSKTYKAILEGVINLFVAGPTINAIKSIMAAFNGVLPVINPEEVIQDIYSDNLYNYVITDKVVYKFEKYQNVLKNLNIGSVVHAGDVLVDTVQIYDYLIDRHWWKTVTNTPKIGLSPHIFIGSYKHQLFFSTSPELVTRNINGVINFPVLGNSSDIAQFNSFLNAEENIQSNLAALGLNNPGNTAVIVPADFIFNNFIKNNTALIKFNFYTPDDVAVFFNHFPIIQKYLPPHVYIMLYINLNLSADTYSGMNSRYTIPGFPGAVFSLDGSNYDGTRPKKGANDPGYYKDYKTRLFCLSKTPHAYDGNPLFYSENLEKLTLANSSVARGGTGPRAIDGKVFTNIPITNPPKTNADIPTVLLIDFS